MNALFPISSFYSDVKHEVLPYGIHPNVQPVLVSNGATPVSTNAAEVSPSPVSKSQRRFLHESDAAREKRLARNAERMRQKRAAESEDEYRKRLARNAENNRRKRQSESDVERTMRHVRDAARQRLRRAMESSDQRAIRLKKLAERMRHSRANETQEQRQNRLAKNASKAKERLLKESPEQWIERKRKKAEYARKKRSEEGKPKANVEMSNDNDGVTQQLNYSQDAPYSSSMATTTVDVLSPTTEINATGLSPATNKTEPKTVMSPIKPTLPEHIYTAPHLLFNETDLKPPEFLHNPHTAMQPDHLGACNPGSLYKFHILPYSPFPPADYKHKQ